MCVCVCVSYLVLVPFIPGSSCARRLGGWVISLYQSVRTKVTLNLTPQLCNELTLLHIHVLCIIYTCPPEVLAYFHSPTPILFYCPQS